MDGRSGYNTYLKMGPTELGYVNTSVRSVVCGTPAKLPYVRAHASIIHPAGETDWQLHYRWLMVGAL
jgi:hypothetical protein